MSRWSLDDSIDPYAPLPPLCALHGTRLETDGYCEDCYLAIYESTWTWADEIDDRDEREREKE